MSLPSPRETFPDSYFYLPTALVLFPAIYCLNLRIDLPSPVGYKLLLSHILLNLEASSELHVGVGVKGPSMRAHHRTSTNGCDYYKAEINVGNVESQDTGVGLQMSLTLVTLMGTVRALTS